jgi:hypothetical protein
MIAINIPLAWALAPFGRTVDMMGIGEAGSFARTMLRLLHEGLAALQGVEAAIPATVLLCLFTPLCSSATSTLVAAPHWTAAHAQS